MQDTLIKPEVQDFECLKLRIHNHVCALSVTQGEEEGLILRGPSHLLNRINASVHSSRLNVDLDGGLTDRLGDAFTTSLSRQKIKIDLTVCELQELDLGGFVEGMIFDVKVDDLNLIFTGLGNLKVAELRGRSLTSTLKGTPSVQVGGKMEEQRVTVKGMGQYQAGDLKTQRTEVHLSGSAFATVWAEKELEIEMQGMGSVEYYGRPSVSRRTIGMNNLKALGVR